MQWESCLACSSLRFGYLVPENVRQLFSRRSGQVAFTPGHLNTKMCYFYIEHVCHACMHVLHMPDMMLLGSHIMQTMSL